MAEHTPLKELSTDMNNLSLDVKHMLNLIEPRHAEYSTRFQTVEST